MRAEPAALYDAFEVPLSRSTFDAPCPKSSKYSPGPKDCKHTSVRACRRNGGDTRTGSVFSAQASFPRESVVVKGDGTEFVRVGDEGGQFKFTFCPECRSTVFYVEEGHEQRIAIPVGAFADSHFPAPTVSVYEKRRTRENLESLHRDLRSA